MATRRNTEGQFRTDGQMAGGQEIGMGGQAEGAKEKAKGMGERIRDRASDMVEDRKDQLASGIERASDRLEDRAESMEDQGGMRRRAGRIAHRASDMLEDSAEYLHTKPVSTIRDDITGQIREHPYVSVGVALGTGFLLGRALGGGEEENEEKRHMGRQMGMGRGRFSELSEEEHGLGGGKRSQLGKMLAAGLSGMVARQVRKRVGGR